MPFSGGFLIKTWGKFESKQKNDFGCGNSAICTGGKRLRFAHKSTIPNFLQFSHLFYIEASLVITKNHPVSTQLILLPACLDVIQLFIENSSENAVRRSKDSSHR
jgi:hypothetical protein